MDCKEVEMDEEYDVRFDVASARSWREEVENELQQVEKLLNDVAAECEKTPDGSETDTITQDIIELGQVVGESWGVLCKGLFAICDLFVDIINVQEETINKVSGDIQDYKGSHYL